jgi:uncharacterized membrane protein
LKKLHYLTVSILATILFGFLFHVLLTPVTTQATLNVECNPATNVVDKMQGDAFTVKVTFKNTGDATGTWTVNVSFEGESNWSWHGAPQTLTLKPDKTASLTWTGSVPENASVGSTARLIVYFNDEFAPQNWWIHVLLGAELKIVSSEVK